MATHFPPLQHAWQMSSLLLRKSISVCFSSRYPISLGTITAQSPGTVTIALPTLCSRTLFWKKPSSHKDTTAAVPPNKAMGEDAAKVRVKMSWLIFDVSRLRWLWCLRRMWALLQEQTEDSPVHWHNPVLAPTRGSQVQTAAGRERTTSRHSHPLKKNEAGTVSLQLFSQRSTAPLPWVPVPPGVLRCDAAAPALCQPWNLLVQQDTE